MGKSVAIIQSCYVPWRGYFDIIRRSDLFILLDDVQFTRRDWRNRNKIKTAQGPHWLTIPVESKGRYLQRISDTVVADPAWSAAHWRTIEAAYRKAPGFEEAGPAIERLYQAVADERRLSAINRCFLEGLAALMGIHTPLARSDDILSLAELDALDPAGRLIALCRAVGADRYISGPAAKSYIEEDRFRDQGIEVVWHDYPDYPDYPQLHGAFDAKLSVVDLLLNVGGDAARFLGDPPAPPRAPAPPPDRDSFDAALIPGIRDRMANVYRELRAAEAEAGMGFVDDHGDLRSSLAEARDCPVCGTASAGADLVIAAQGLDYVTCPCCALTYSRQLLSESADHDRFDDTRATRAHLGLRRNPAYRQLEDAKARFVIGRIEQHSKTGRLLLDVGSANGALMGAAEARGWRTWGIEANPVYVEESRRLGRRVTHGFFPADLPTTWPKFDAITMLDVLEHAPEPLSFLRSAGECLRPGGILAVQVPNLDSLRIRLEGAANNNFVVGHWSFFTPATLDAILGQAGFAPLSRETIISERDRILEHPMPDIGRHIADLRGTTVDTIDTETIHRLEMGYKVFGLYSRP